MTTDLVLYLKSDTVSTDSPLCLLSPISNFSRLEWFGAVGAIVGFFCGIALVWSPLAVVYFYIT
jgi:hypothetical protein